MIFAAWLVPAAAPSCVGGSAGLYRRDAENDFWGGFREVAAAITRAAVGAAVGADDWRICFRSAGVFIRRGP